MPSDIYLKDTSTHNNTLKKIEMEDGRKKERKKKENPVPFSTIFC